MEFDFFSPHPPLARNMDKFLIVRLGSGYVNEPSMMGDDGPIALLENLVFELEAAGSLRSYTMLRFW